ncbi:class I SAM-dependent methyltransferase [Dactylosporangium aurantiacum]|uniref:Class I SAM-dependent methyltransferase n=1 Tax=Dactylosporangium aurantiacum TaxID=35754 RepID=A0A9Q9IQ70_9ACTN|nr:class I SAM-dependent methyltransferase [Dactylosporangium aurantiacum]MDG6105822.1 class I SAM-dependent methyltransferase [Dactylosporangium aurantiacum]UWZ57995.1 class I SAM-dependent methyltransferase [Dactylosporangium aurantiacum]
MTAPAVVYGAALRRAARGEPARLRLVDRHGTDVRPVDPVAWCEGLLPGDDTLLERCPGATLDLGCGPGRLTRALAAAGRRVLGVDASAQAVRLARRHGAPVAHQDLFAPLPDEGRWDHALLADGNIGIGGDPELLLRRCRALLAPDGTVLVELDPPGAGTWRGRLALAGPGRTSTPFPWAFVGADAAAAVAARAALRLVESWTEAGRWFAQLAR